MPNDDPQGRELRLRMIETNIERIEERYQRFWINRGREPAVFVLHLFSNDGRALAENLADHIAKVGIEDDMDIRGQIDRVLANASERERQPLMLLAVELKVAYDMVRNGTRGLHRQLVATPPPADRFPVIVIGLGGTTISYVPKPDLG